MSSYGLAAAATTTTDEDVTKRGRAAGKMNCYSDNLPGGGGSGLAGPQFIPGEPAVPMVPPIVHASTYRVKSLEHFKEIIENGGYAYIRLNNPTCAAVEKVVNEMEGGSGSVVFGSGMAAISTTLLTFLRSGDHLVVGCPGYGCTHNLIKSFLEPCYNIDVTFVDGTDPKAFSAAVRPNTKMFYGETPSNPLLTILDVEAFADAARESGQNILTVVDTTFASPLLLKPIQHGVDIVIHSATKYLGGHEDLCAGILTTRTPELRKSLFTARNLFGGVLSPQDASLLLRGIRTLGIRIQRQCETAQHVALFLTSHREVRHVHYPGLVSHPQHQVAARQMDKFGAMVAFEVKGGLEAAVTVVNSLRKFHLAFSLGGVDSLVEHPATMTHGSLAMSDEDRKNARIEPGLIRLSIGLESADELVSDLQQSLDRISHSHDNTSNCE